jgi:hypothetical protein
MVWVSSPLFLAFFCCDVFVLVTGTSAFYVFMASVSVDFVLVGYVSSVLVFTIFFSMVFETASSISPLRKNFFTGPVVKLLFLGLRLYF